MDVVAELDAHCSADDLFAWVEDLERYPSWLEIVADAGLEEELALDGVQGHVPAWGVELRGRLGPLSRSKRLRMVRTDHEAPHRVRFERNEVDGRQHSSWVLIAEVEPTDSGSRLTMQLHYGGSFGGRLLERMLNEEIERSRPRLLDLTAGPEA